jgi:hypothetical protein
MLGVEYYCSKMMGWYLSDRDVDQGIILFYTSFQDMAPVLVELLGDVCANRVSHHEVSGIEV